jgi:hypothetical protein|tara:strand:- start:17 stop:514 length:498 start_codon:yes stop_codon:yes gene_type:complete
MAQTSYPFENVDTTETQFSKWARHIGEGVNGGPDNNKLKPSGDDSGMQLRIASGECMVRGHYYISTAQETLSIDSAGTESRVDAVTLELDPAANQIILKIVQGLAVASNPQPPTLTQTDTGIYQVLLGLVTVAPDATSILAADVTDRRTFLSAQLAFSPFLLMGA